MASSDIQDALTIAVDFDGTIVEHAYPAIGREMEFAFTTLRALQQKGHRLILWTIREGALLDEAVQYCAANGVTFYAVNRSYPEEEYNTMSTRKIQVDLFIDDRNVGGFPGWSRVWQMLHPEGGPLSHQLTDPEAHHNSRGQKGGLFKKLFR